MQRQAEEAEAVRLAEAGAARQHAADEVEVAEQEVGAREKEIGRSGGSLEPPRPLLTHLHAEAVVAEQQASLLASV